MDHAAQHQEHEDPSNHVNADLQHAQVELAQISNLVVQKIEEMVGNVHNLLRICFSLMIVLFLLR